jgi:O-antigen ligase
VLAVLAGAAAGLQWRTAIGQGASLGRRAASGEGVRPGDRAMRYAAGLHRARPVAVAALVLALAGTAVLVAQVERGDGSGASRLASVQSNRYEYWKVAVRSFADHPLIGVGAGGFQAEWLRERPFREGVRDAHSLYLETAAELGLVGLALLALLFGGVAAAARRALPAAAGSVATLAAWALHAGLDWDWELPALTLVAIVLAGQVLATSSEARAAAGGRGP